MRSSAGWRGSARWPASAWRPAHSCCSRRRRPSGRRSSASRPALCWRWCRPCSPAGGGPPTREYAEDVAHEHAHGHAHHHHGPAADADRRWLGVALGVIATFMVVEVVAGILADSLALLSDAAHMLTDAGAHRRRALRRRAGGAAGRGALHLRPRARRDPLAPRSTAPTLLVLAGVIAVEAIRRLWSPPDVEGGFVLVVGLLGACANVGAALALRQGRAALAERRGRPRPRAHRPLRARSPPRPPAPSCSSRASTAPTRSPRSWWPR